jgi:predicted nucleic acid-binding protein
MGRVALDSSVLIALLNDNDSHHDLVYSRIKSVENHYEISAVTLMECLVGPYMESARTATEIRRKIAVAIGSIEPLTDEVAVEAAKIRATTRLKAPDSIICASARLTGATLWTLDRRLAKAHKGAVLVA